MCGPANHYTRELTWLALAGVGCGAAPAVGALVRTGRLAPAQVAEYVPA